MKKIILLGIGILFLAISLFFMILYLNLFTLGYSFFDYVHFISSRIEFYFLWIGILCIIIYLKGKDQN